MDTKEILYTIGQALGYVAVALAVISYQMKTQKKLLILKLANSLVKSAHYLFIGAITGMALNLVGAVKYPFYMRRNTKGDNTKLIPLIFTGVTVAVGIISWTEWYSVFIFSGMVIHAFCMSFSDPQKVRISLLITSPLVIIHDVLVASIAGVIFESFTIISSVIGIIRYRKKKTAEGEFNENDKQREADK